MVRPPTRRALLWSLIAVGLVLVVPTHAPPTLPDSILDHPADAVTVVAPGPTAQVAVTGAARRALDARGAGPMPETAILASTGLTWVLALLAIEALRVDDAPRRRWRALLTGAPPVVAAVHP